MTAVNRPARARAASSARARSSVAAVTRALPVSAPSCSKVSLSASWPSVPRAKGSGSGSKRRGLSSRSTNQATGQPIHFSSEVADQTRSRSTASTRSSSSPAAAGSGSGSALSAPRSSAPSARRRALLGEPLVEEVADVVDEQRARERPRIVVALVPAEHELLQRPRDERVEQVALGGERLRALAEHQPGGLSHPGPLAHRRAASCGRARCGNTPSCRPREEQRAHAPGAQRAGGRARPRARDAGSCPPLTSTAPSTVGELGAPAGAASAARRASSRSSASALRPPASARASSSSSRRAPRRGRGAARSKRREQLARRALGERARARAAGPRRAGRSCSRGKRRSSQRARACSTPCAARRAGPRARALSASSGRSRRPGARSQASRSRGRARRRAVAGGGHAAQQRRSARGRSAVSPKRRLSGIAKGIRGRREDLARAARRWRPGGGRRPRSPPRARPSPSSAATRARDQLELGAFAPALHQLDRACPGRCAAAPVSNSDALEVRERPREQRARSARRGRSRRAMLAGERRERLEGARAPGEGDPARLVGERDGHLRVEHAAERLDRVELESA